MINLTHLVGLDFETYANVSLPDVGLMRYLNDPYFQPTLASVSCPSGSVHTLEFPMARPNELRRLLRIYGEHTVVCAHNAGFERGVLNKMGINIPILDSAVVARVAGADSHLAGAARQLLDMDKLDEDRSLLRLFAMRQEGQVDPAFDEGLIAKHPDKWQQYREYCERDADLSRRIILEWCGNNDIFDREMRYAAITLKMNEIGWPVDVASIREMKARYEQNLSDLRYDFALNVDADLNISSHPQVKKWCEDRGIRSKSFDKQAVERMITRLDKLSIKGLLNPGYLQVYQLLKLKQAMGGSSLKKLDTILTVQHNGRVYDQYVHAGAAQSLRTSGRSVQMQNLPRLAHQRDMYQLHLSEHHWTNDELAGNLRQVFRSSHPRGQLVVADFASIESRALAYLSDEAWKTKAYSTGQDVYKAQAMKIFNLSDISQVSKEQRTTGKVGELSCGYGAGPVAVKDFAGKMGVELEESEATQLVRDWRDANPNTVEFWRRLGNAMVETVMKGDRTVVLCADAGITISFVCTTTPESLLKQAPDVKSVRMNVWKSGDMLMSRVFHGFYMRGQNVGYYKPSSLKGGRAWKKMYTDPKTKRQRYYELYGGKLAGILTQSLCREIFFEALNSIDLQLNGMDNAHLIGQFHDEVVVDWVPGRWPLRDVVKILEEAMSFSATHPKLPMGVEVKHDYRYTK